jgi:hypothetical protein
MDNLNFLSTCNLPNEKNPEGSFESEQMVKTRTGNLIVFQKNNAEAKVFVLTNYNK